MLMSFVDLWRAESEEGAVSVVAGSRDHMNKWIESNTWCPRLTAAMILSGSAVHVNGSGSWFVSATKR
jgi:hypothetical protein